MKMRRVLFSSTHRQPRYFCSNNLFLGQIAAHIPAKLFHTFLKLSSGRVGITETLATNESYKFRLFFPTCKMLET